MIVVIALAEREQRHEERVARTASCRIRLASDRMASRVNQERAVLEHDNFRNTADEKTAERPHPAVPKEAERCRQNEAHQYGDDVNMSMLPHDQRVLSQISHVIVWRLRPELEQKPADVRMEKAFADVVWIFVVIDMFMVAAMIARPQQHRVLERPCTKN